MQTECKCGILASECEYHRDPPEPEETRYWLRVRYFDVVRDWSSEDLEAIHAYVECIKKDVLKPHLLMFFSSDGRMTAKQWEQAKARYDAGYI